MCQVFSRTTRWSLTQDEKTTHMSAPRCRIPRFDWLSCVLEAPQNDIHPSLLNVTKCIKIRRPLEDVETLHGTYCTLSIIFHWIFPISRPKMENLSTSQAYFTLSVSLPMVHTQASRPKTWWSVLKTASDDMLTPDRWALKVSTRWALVMIGL